MNVAGMTYRDQLKMKAEKRVQFNRGFDLAIELVTRADEFELILVRSEAVRSCSHSFSIGERVIKASVTAGVVTEKGTKAVVVSAEWMLEVFQNSPQAVEASVEKLYAELRKGIAALSEGKK